MKRSGAEIIVTLIERQGVKTVTGIPGGANLPIYDALGKGGLRHVLARHEQGAGFIAQGMARVSGRAEVCMGTSGPGTTNLLTAIADARLDSIPLVAITGQVPGSFIGTDAFQEVDTCGITVPITKQNFLARSPEELLEIVPLAFRIAESGRPGPVLIDVPKDVQKQTARFDRWPDPKTRQTPAPPNDREIHRLADMIEAARRPILYIGGGIIASGASEEIRRLARKNGLPVTSTLMGLGAFPTDDPLYLGMLGMHGARYTNYALEEADLLIAVGVRFDDRATGKADEFCPTAAIAHIDIDRAQIGKIKHANLSIASDAGEAIRRLIPLVKENPRSEWNDRIARLKEEFPLETPEESDPLHPINLVKIIGRILEPSDIISTDVGQHQMWAAQVYPFKRPRTWLTSGGLGTMGFGVPAAIGAALAVEESGNPGSRRSVCISGDGSFLMNMQELATMADLGLPVKIIIFNNGHLGLVRQQQELFYGERYLATRFETVPDFTALARAFGIPSCNLGDSSDPVDMLKEALEAPGSFVVDAPIHFEENVFPMVAPGGANREMIGGLIHA